jgi:hypothetical protein
MFHQHVIAEFDNNGSYLYLFRADKKITAEMVSDYFEKTHGIENWEKNGFTFVDSPEHVNLD